PFTRDSSTEIACCISAADGAPFAVCACSTTSVPLDRSSPRPTLNWLCQLAGLNVWPAVIEKNMTRIRIRISVDGLNPLDDEVAASGATFPMIGASFRLTSLAGWPVVLRRSCANLRSVAALLKTHNHPTRFPMWIVTDRRDSAAETDICPPIATVSLQCFFPGQSNSVGVSADG